MEKRLIDANALEAMFLKFHMETDPLDNDWFTPYLFVKDAPTIDAVEVVRCRECIHRGSAYCPMCHEDYYFDEDDGADYVTRDYTEDDAYCNQGERMEGDDSDG